MGISLKPSAAVEGTGFLDDVQATITEARFEMFDYNGKAMEAVPALKLALLVEGETEPHMQYYSMGRAKDFVASKDGKTLQPVGTATALNAGSNGMILLGSLVNAGFPEDKLDDDITVLDGTVAHFIRQPAPKRANSQPKKEGQADPTILVIDQIIQLPGEKAQAKKGAAKGGTKSTAKAAAPAADSGMEDDAVNAIMEILAEKGGTITKQQIPALIFAKVKDNPNKNDIVKLAFTDDFLGAEGRPWSFADGKVSLG